MPIIGRTYRFCSVMKLVCTMIGFSMMFVARNGHASTPDNWSPLLLQPTTPLSVAGSAGWQSALVPPFRAASRNRATYGLNAIWHPTSQIEIDLRGDYVKDSFTTKDSKQGFGDVRIGTTAILWSSTAWGPAQKPSFSVGWQTKLPNAQDEGEIGTDETDATLLGGFTTALGRVALGIDAGLAIWGNPLMFANQDDLLVTHLAVRAPVGPIALSSNIGGYWASARNPARHELRLGVAPTDCPFFGVDTMAGLTPAAPDWGANIWIAWKHGCPDKLGD